MTLLLDMMIDGLCRISRDSTTINTKTLKRLPSISNEGCEDAITDSLASSDGAVSDENHNMDADNDTDARAGASDSDSDGAGYELPTQLVVSIINAVYQIVSTERCRQPTELILLLGFPLKQQQQHHHHRECGKVV